MNHARLLIMFHLRIFFPFAIVASLFLSPPLLAQELFDDAGLGFDKALDFSKEELEKEFLETDEVVAEAESKPLPAKPGSVEAAIHFAETVESLQEPGKLAPVLRIAFTLTLLTLLPSILLTMTSFTRIIIVFSFVRRAMTLQTLPPNQILVGLSLFLTYFIMSPTIDRINEEALQPMLKQELSEVDAMKRAGGVMHEFMRRYTRKKDIALFVNISGIEAPKSAAEVPMRILLPAFVTSELKTAFQMGFIIFLPFLVIDIVVAVVLTAMGMFMLPPPMISIPFKILLFVLVDGWGLIIQSLALSFS